LPTRLILIIDVSELLAASVADAETVRRVTSVVHGGGKRPVFMLDKPDKVGGVLEKRS
jgi:hypothetical protein